ncbi:MAG: preprotein translocase subunit SecG [bacterium]
MHISTIILIILAAILVTLILLQQRGTALGGAFGGSGDFYGTKRGAEKMIFIATVVVAVLFLGLALANVLFFHG